LLLALAIAPLSIEIIAKIAPMIRPITA